MKILNKKIILISLLYFSLTTNIFANQNYMFVNVDKLVNETNIGKLSLSKINELDQNNFKILNKYQEELIKTENEIKAKKNIISEQQYNKEINELKLKIKNYNDEKNLMVQKLNDIKKKELKLFFDSINPIIQDYMKQNSIEIIFDKKNIFIGNKKLDLTELLINEINSKIK